VSCRHLPTQILLVVRRRVGYHSYMAEKNKAAQELGRLGGAKGGRARAANMTPEERSESARKAANARWAKKRQQERSS
jgi:general stress protein YciG